MTWREFQKLNLTKKDGPGASILYLVNGEYRLYGDALKEIEKGSRQKPVEPVKANPEPIKDDFPRDEMGCYKWEIEEENIPAPSDTVKGETIVFSAPENADPEPMTEKPRKRERIVDPEKEKRGPSLPSGDETEEKKILKSFAKVYFDKKPFDNGFIGAVKGKVGMYVAISPKRVKVGSGYDREWVNTISFLPSDSVPECIQIIVEKRKAVYTPSREDTKSVAFNGVSENTPKNAVTA